MDKNLNYQQARRIRGTGLTSILADQLLYEPTIMSAIKRTLSLKTQASVKGIKERFDPLNIAKILTFGSKLGPSILGKMTGRSREDIEYFTGRLKPIAVRKGGKITKIPKEGEQLVEGKNVSIGGINEQLLKIYKFLKQSKSADIKRKEMSQNFAEERSMESDRRHKELLKALDKLKNARTGTETLEKIQNDEAPSGGLDASLLGILNDLKWLAGVTSVEALVGLLTGPIALGILAAALIGTSIFALWKAHKEGPNAEDAADILKTGTKETIEQFGGREKLIEKIKTDAESAKKILESNDEEKIKEAGGREKLMARIKAGEKPEEIKNEAYTAYNKVQPRPTTGERLSLRQSSWDSKYGQTHNPDGTPKLEPVENKAQTPAPTATQQPSGNTGTTGETKVPQGGSTVSPSATAASESNNGMAPAPTASPVSSPPATTQKLNSAMNENVNAQLPKQKSADNLVVNNVMKSANKNTQETAKLSEISVRNDEPTLMRMIMKSTRVV